MDEKKKDLTIYDLAEELKLSPSTVSRALNDHQSIGKKTKEAVQQLAKERGYRPNTIASSLRTNRSNTIGIMVPWINRPFISSMISGIEAAARAEGYHTIISQSHDSTELETENLQALYDSRISALIVSLAMETNGFQHFKLFSDNNIPIVFVDRIPHLSGVNKVQINNFDAAFKATQHLIEQGCRRIAHYGGARHQSIYKERMRGYTEALKKNHIEVDPAIIFNSDSLSDAEGTRLTEHILRMNHVPDGIFAANDKAAVAAIQCAKKHGIRIPDDLAIIGFNDDPVCEIVEPPLSSVYHPAPGLGKAAVDQAISMINGVGKNKTAVSGVVLDTHLVIRASSLRKQTRAIPQSTGQQTQ